VRFISDINKNFINNESKNATMEYDSSMCQSTMYENNKNNEDGDASVSQSQSHTQRNIFSKIIDYHYSTESNIVISNLTMNK